VFWRLWWLWRNLVPSDGNSHAIRRPGDGSRSIFTSCTVWWRLRSIRRTRVLHSSQGLQLSVVKLFTQCLAMLNHSYYFSFNNFQNLCIQFVFSSMYLCIYIATYLHTVYLDWPHAVIVNNLRFAWRWRLSELRNTLRGRDLASLEMQLETEIEWTQRCTGRPWSIEIGDAPGGHDRANVEMHFEAVIEWVWRCNWRRRFRELRDALRAVIERV